MYQGLETCRHCGRRVFLSGEGRKCPICGQGTAQPEYRVPEIVVESEPKEVRAIPKATPKDGETDTLARSRLFEIAVPELYEQNAFRVLGLAVDASLRDVRRRQKKMERTARLGIESKRRAGYLPLRPTPGEDRTREATHRLQDPIARFLDEFFWFWPRQGRAKDDDVLRLMERGRVQDAHKRWLRYEDGKGSDNASTHNLAVLYHVSALDFEQRLLKESLTAEDNKTRVGCWKRAYGRWRVLLNDTSFWDRVRERIVELDDPQLTPQAVGEIRECLGKIVLLVHARIAVRAAEKGNVALAKQHVAIMRGSGLESHLVDEALRESVRYIRERTKMLCNAAESKADADPPNALAVAWDLLRETEPLLRTVNVVLSAEDFVRQGASDEVANTALRCQISYANKTEDWRSSLEVLQAILNGSAERAMLPCEMSQSMRARLKQNVDIINTNLRLAMCHFCGTRKSDDDADLQVPMHGNVRRTHIGQTYVPGGIQTRYRVTWQHATVRIPRCPECKKNHAIIEAWTGGLGLAGAVLGALGFFIVWWAGIVGILVGGIAGAVTGQLIGDSAVPYKIKGSSDYSDFPAMKELLDQGWKAGEKPSEEEQNSAPIG